METIKVSIEESVLQNISELYDQVELQSLRCALHPEMERFVEIPMNLYDDIKCKMSVHPVKIKVASYYGIPSYYSIMPQPVFDALEAANLNGEEFALVDRLLFDQMIIDYKNKIKQWEASNS